MSENIIKIDTGVVTKTFVTTDGKECEFAFNPLDMGLSRRLFSAFEKLDKMNDGYKDEVQKTPIKRKFLTLAKRWTGKCGRSSTEKYSGLISAPRFW